VERLPVAGGGEVAQALDQLFEGHAASMSWRFGTMTR
jgi:hypothetical protein